LALDWAARLITAGGVGASSIAGVATIERVNLDFPAAAEGAIPAGGTALTPLGPFIPLAVDGAKSRVAGSVLLTTSSTLPATMKHWSLHQAHAVAGAVGTGRGTPAPILPVSPLTIHWANVAGAILLLV